MNLNLILPQYDYKFSTIMVVPIIAFSIHHQHSTSNTCISSNRNSLTMPIPIEVSL